MVYAHKLRLKNIVLTRQHQNLTQLPDIPLTYIHRPPSPARTIPTNDPTAELTSALEELGTAIQHHVEHTYLLTEHQQRYNRGAAFKTFSSLSFSFLKHDAQALTDLCLAPATRHGALRHLIAAAIFSAIDFSAFNERALLPLPVLAFWEALPGGCETGRDAESTFIDTLITVIYVPLLMIPPALHNWLQLSITLLNPPSPVSHPLSANTNIDINILEPPSTIQPQVVILRDLLDLILGTFVPAGHEQKYQQSEQLEKLIWAGARFGYRLLSQPGRWSFNWHAEGGRELVLVPGLVRVGGDEGGVGAPLVSVTV